MQSQAQIRANFQAINIVWGDNHFPLTALGESQGMHNVLTMRPAAGDPTTDSTHVAFYNKLVSSVPALFFRPNSNQTPIQLTYPSISTSNTATQQYSYVAGPFVIYGGIIKGITTSTVVTLTPTTTLIYVGLTVANYPGNKGSVLIAATISGSSFTINFTVPVPPVAFDVYYLAIGQ